MSAKPSSSAAITQAYRAVIGRPRTSLTTPALILDLRIVRGNITRMAKEVAGSATPAAGGSGGLPGFSSGGLPGFSGGFSSGGTKSPARGRASLRPHAKGHKCAQVARLQLDAGACGVTVATVWEAAALAEAGIDDILIANEVVGWEKIRVAAETAKRVRHLTVVVDDSRNAQELSAACSSADTRVGVLIDIDTGMHRCGLRSIEDALRLADRLSRLPGLRMQGVMGYEGHCVHEKDRAVRAGLAADAMDRLVEFADRLAEAGNPVEVISAGATATWDLTAHPRVTELQPGSYVFMDTTRMPMAPGFACGLTVLSTVVSRQATTAADDRAGGPVTLVLDAGRKTMGVEPALPQIAGELGLTVTPRSASEEHLTFDAGRDCPLKIGDRVEVIPGYGPTTVNLHEVYFVAEGDTIVDVWPVLARGPGPASVRA